MYQNEVRSVRVDCAFSSMVTRRMAEADNIFTGDQGGGGQHRVASSELDREDRSREV